MSEVSEAVASRRLAPIMLVVLALSLAAALAVRKHGLGLARLELEEPQTLAGLRIRPPRGWVTVFDAEGARLQESPVPDRAAPCLEVRLNRCERLVSPLEHLVRIGELHRADLLEAVFGDEDVSRLASTRSSPILVAGWPGVLVEQTVRMPQVESRQPQAVRRVLACGILPSMQAIVLRWQGPVHRQSDDARLVRAVAGAVAPESCPPRQTEGQIRLLEDVRIGLPAGWSTWIRTDRFWDGATLIRSEGTSWLGVNLIGCAVLDDPVDVLRSMLLLREGQWPAGPVRQVDQRTWVYLHPDRLFPGASFLRVSGDGLGLLVALRWAPLGSGQGPSDEQVLAMGRAMTDGAQFPETSRVGRLLEAGQAALKRLPPDITGVLSEGDLQNRQWEWFDQSVPRTIPMMVRHQVDEGVIEGVRHTVRWPPLSSEGHEHLRWQLRRDLSRYRSALVRASQQGTVSLQTDYADGRLRMVAYQAEGTVARFEGSAPGGFIPGGLLPLVAGCLPFEPMLLRTEWVPDTSLGISAVPLVVILEPSFDQPKVPAGQEEAMRCWAVHVSGTGQSARWYLDSSGRLDSMSYGGGLHLHQIPSVPATQAAAGRGGESWGGSFSY